MYEYKVEVYRVKEAEKEMNALAKQGWRIISVTACDTLSWNEKNNRTDLPHIEP